MFARRFRNCKEREVVNAGFEFEFDQDAGEAPVGPNAVDQLRQPHEPQPQFRLIALYFSDRAVEKSRLRSADLPAINAGRAIIADGGAMNDSVVSTRADFIFHELLEFVVGAVPVNRPAV